MAIWTMAGNLNIPRHSLAGLGNSNAQLSFGGFGSPVFYPDDETYDPTQGIGKWKRTGAFEPATFLRDTEKFNGSTWSVSGRMLTALGALDGAGIQNAGVCFGGNNDEASHETELFNGTVWQYSSGYLVVGRWGLAGCGTQNAALAFGGFNPQISATPIPFPSTSISKVTEEFDGLIWSHKGDLIIGSDTLAGMGVVNAALGAGGTADKGVGTSYTQKFNGSVWSLVSGGNLNVARYGLGGCGIQNNALTFGGRNKNNTYVTTELFNGFVWINQANLNVARNLLVGAGSASNGLSFGGTVGASIGLGTTEKFS